MVQAFGALAGLVILIALAGELIALVFPYLIWPVLAIAGIAGMWVLGRQLSEKRVNERAQKEATEEKLRIAQAQRAELEDLHS